MSSLTTRRRFFASAALLLAALGCSRKSAPHDEAPVVEEEFAPAAADDDSAAAGPLAENPPGAPAEATTALEVVTAEALLDKLRASGRKGTLVNAWASFCGPCKREIPMLEALAKRLRPRGIDVVLVSVDEPTDGTKAEVFLRERDIRLTSYLAARPLGAFKRGMNPRWPGMLPASFLFDREGVLRYYWGGEAFENEVLPVLEAFLEGRPLEGESVPLVAPENAR